MPVETMWSDDGIVLRLPEAADELPLDELLIDPDEIDELVVVDAAADVAVRRPLPRVRGPGAAAAPPPARPAHAAVAAAPAGGRPAGGGGQVPDVPDPAGDHPRVPARRVRPARRCARCSASCAAAPIRVVTVDTAKAVAVRPVPAVRLDRRLHVRGRRAAGRAAGRGAGARPRPAARPARRRGAARAARPGRARRPRARAAVPRRRPPGPRAPTSCTTCCAGSATSRRPRSTCAARAPGAAAEWLDAARRRAPGHRGARSPARSGSPPPRTRPATATRSACALPLGLPAAFTEPVAAPARGARRPATPAPTGRSSPTRSPAGSASPSSGSPARSAALEADGPRGARRVPARRRRARVVRRRRAAPAAPALAGRAAPRGRAGRARGAGPLPARRGTASARRPARPRRAGRGARACCRARRSSASTLETRRAAGRACAATGRPTSTSCAPSGERGVGRRRRARRHATAGSGCASRDQLAAARRRGRASAEPPDGRAARRHPRRTSPQRGASFWSQLRAGRARRDRRRAARPRCGTWCGPARSPTTRSRRCGRCVGGGAGQARPAAPRRAAAAGRGPGRLDPARPAGRRRAAGRWSRRCSSPRPTPTEVGPRHGACSCSSATASHPRGGAGRGRGGRVRRVYGVLKVLEERGQVRRGYFVAGLGAAQFALPGAVDRLRGRARAPDGDCTPSRRRPRWCWPPPTRPSPTAPRCPGPTSAAAGRPGRPARCVVLCSGAAGGLARPSGPPPRHVPGGGRGRRRLGRRPRRRWSRTAGSAASRCARSTASRPASRRCAGTLRAAGFVDGYRGLVLRTVTVVPPSRSGHRPNLGRVPEGDTIHRTAAALRARRCSARP